MDAAVGAEGWDRAGGLTNTLPNLILSIRQVFSCILHYGLGRLFAAIIPDLLLPLCGVTHHHGVLFSDGCPGATYDCCGLIDSVTSSGELTLGISDVVSLGFAAADVGPGPEGLSGWIRGYYTRGAAFFWDPGLARADGSLWRLLARLKGIGVLVVDD
jgi:hypothetical protein